MSNQANYLVINMSPNPANMEKVQQYISKITPLLGGYGGEMVSRFDVTDLVEGTEAPKSVGMVRFPNHESLKAAVTSSEYHALSGLRSEAFTHLTVMVCAPFGD